MYSNILVPVDLDHGDGGQRALLLARQIGGSDAKITLLTVTEPTWHAAASHVPEDAATRHDDDLLLRLRALVHEIDETAAVEVRHGNPAATIIEEAKMLGADAIVLASHAPTLRGHLFGSLATRIVQHASCSVLVDRATA